jgi:two-component system NtrC family sensor kinase
LEAEEGRGGWEVRVADNGPGIAQHLMGNVFDPFVTSKNAGTGLGLAIVKTLCERMGWQIEWMQPLRRAATYPDMPTGSCFTLSAPKASKASQISETSEIKIESSRDSTQEIKLSPHS